MRLAPTETSLFLCTMVIPRDSTLKDAKTRSHQIKDGTHRTIPLEYTGNFDEHSDEI
jgi:hypothetical protein